MLVIGRLVGVSAIRMNEAIDLLQSSLDLGVGLVGDEVPAPTPRLDYWTGKLTYTFIIVALIYSGGNPVQYVPEGHSNPNSVTFLAGRIWPSISGVFLVTVFHLAFFFPEKLMISHYHHYLGRAIP